MVKHYCRIYDDLIAASQEEGSTIKITSPASVNRAKKIKAILEEIHWVTAALQEQNLSLHDGQRFLDEPSRQVQKHKDTSSHAFYQCRLKIEKASARSHLTPDYAFETGVIKI